MSECDQFKGRLKDLCMGRGLDGRPNPPLRAANSFRAQRGLLPIGGPLEKEWDVTQPSRGLGDVVAKFTHATGIDRVVKAVTGKKGCGCKKRQEALNNAVPFRRKSVPETTLPPQVAIIIAGRNNGPFLAEAIESALNQSIQCEVVYADDCSFDDSVSIAKQYEQHGLKVLPSKFHRGVCDARNRGSAATTAPYLMNLDSDDYLSPNYAETHLAAMRSDTPFAYSPAQCFGVYNGKAACVDWRDGDIFATNFVNTSALYSRWAFDLAGGWIDMKTAWDWDLAMRAMKFGTPVRTDAVLYYRRHRDSWSFNHDLSGRMDGFRIRGSLLSVCVFVKNEPSCETRQWLSDVVNATRQVGLRAELILSDCSQGMKWAEESSIYRDAFQSIRVIPLADVKRMKSEAAGNLVWIVDESVSPLLVDLLHCVPKLITGTSPPKTASEPSGVTIYRRTHP